MNHNQTRPGAILPIALMAFAIVAFLVLVNFAVARPPANHNTTNTPPVLTEEQALQGVLTYKSDKLGITFNYLNTFYYHTTFTEQGDKIFVGINLPVNELPQKGQWVEVMSKDPQDSLPQAIQKKLLNEGTGTTKCLIEKMSPPASDKFPVSVSTYVIKENDSDQNYECDHRYTGVGYFWMDGLNPSKMLFFGLTNMFIVQGSDDPTTNWASTVRIVAATAGWKTYLSDKGWSIQYPPTYQQSITSGFTFPSSVVKISSGITENVEFTVTIEEFPNDKSNRSLYDWQAQGFPEPYSAGNTNKTSLQIGNTSAVRFNINVTGQTVYVYYIRTATTMWQIYDRRIGPEGQVNEDIIQTFTLTN